MSKYKVITASAMFDLTLGSLGISKGSVAGVDANGTRHAYQGAEIITVMREDFADQYFADMEELESLRKASQPTQTQT